jgi:hypothetical protein
MLMEKLSAGQITAAIITRNDQQRGGPKSGEHIRIAQECCLISADRNCWFIVSGLIAFVACSAQTLERISIENSRSDDVYQNSANQIGSSNRISSC